MRLVHSSLLLSVCTFTLVANALPLSEVHGEAHVARRKAPYSVVAVDGSQSDGAAPPETHIVTKGSTQTVTEPAKTLPPVTETILSTTIVAESESPTTVVTTVTASSTPIATPAPAPEVSASICTSSEIVTSTVLSADTIVATATPTPTRTPYDDGMWHTTYYKPAEQSSGPEANNTVADMTVPSTVVETATFNSLPSNGTYALVLRGDNKPVPSNTPPKQIGTRSTLMSVMKTKPPMPTLPTTSEVVNPTQVPSVDFSKHQVPGFGR